VRGQFAFHQETFLISILDGLGNSILDSCQEPSSSMATITMDPFLTEPDTIVLRNLLNDVKENSQSGQDISEAKAAPSRSKTSTEEHRSKQNEVDISRLQSFNDPQHPDFTPTVSTKQTCPCLE
jgi:hypothetical protein